MTVSNPSLSVSKKKFQIHGFRFFQNALENLREEVYDYSSLGHHKSLDASATAMYVGMVSKCNHSGLLDADTHISTITESLGLPRATGNAGINQLLDRGLIIERIVGEKSQYEIVGYALNNLAREESSDPDQKLSYFTVPFELLHTTVLATLVSKKSPKGIILMLELFNDFRHKLRNEKALPSEFKTERLTSTLKEKLGKSSSKRVRDVLTALSPVLTFNPIDLQERKPRETILTRLRKEVTQIWVRKYEITIKPACIIEREEYNVDSIKALKDADYRIRNLKLPLYQADRIGIASAYKGAVKEIANFIKDEKQKRSLLRDSMQDALEQLEDYIRKGNKLSSIGAFINSKLQKFVISFLDKNNLFIDIESWYRATDSPVPHIWTTYQKHKKNQMA